MNPASFHCRLRHSRTAPFSPTFTYGTYLWLVDLDDMPSLPWPLRPLARFEARDHVGDPSASIRSNVDAYLAEHGLAKESYVSPFFPVDGEYRTHLPEPTDRLFASISPHRADGRPFVATPRGTGRPATTGALLAAALRYPWVTAGAAARIRRHGIGLFPRGLPVQPRPESAPVEEVR